MGLAKDERIRISQGDFVKEFPAILDVLLQDKNVKPEKYVELRAVAYIKMCVDTKERSLRSKV